MNSEDIWSKEALAEYMTKSDLFRSLNASLLQKLLCFSEVRTYKKRQFVYHQSDFPKFVFLVLRGLIKTFHTFEDGTKTTLHLLNKGATFTESYAFTKEPVPFSAQAMDEVSILAISMSAIRELAFKDMDFSQNLLKVISEQHTETLSRLTAMTKPPLEKTGFYLLNLKLNNESRRFKFPYLKSLIASYLGITPETFSRSLAEIKKSGIKVEGDELTLQSEYSLCQFCELNMVSKCKYYDSLECKWAS